MASDAGMIIGESHLVCQDYARTLDAPRPDVECAGRRVDAGPLPAEKWAFVSDGCSGSPDTDIGARILILSAIETVLQGGDPFEAGQSRTIALLAACSARQLGLNPHSIDATLLAIRHDPCGQRFGFMVAGDGVIGLKQGAAIRLLEVSYPSGCPYYLSYELNDQRKQAFALNPSGIIRQYVRTGDAWTLRDETKVNGPYTCFWPARVGDVAFAVTDGACSVRRKTSRETTKTSSPVRFTEVIERLVAFKGTQGRFVSRRMRGFQKEASAENWFSHDDIGLAAISWEDPEDADHRGEGNG